MEGKKEEKKRKQERKGEREGQGKKEGRKPTSDLKIQVANHKVSQSCVI